MAAAYALLAAEHGWSARYIERELTDELFVLYLDEILDRHEDRARAEFDASIEAVRAGTIFAHDQKQYRRWIAELGRRARGSRALTGQALERHIAQLSYGRPDLVKHVSA